MIYFILVDRFANGDPANDADANPADPVAFHGGDLAGVRANLDHLQRLGVETVWLSPIFRMRTTPFYGHAAFHGYWVEDLTTIEPRFGTEADLRALADDLHARGIGLYLDIVWNHVAPEGELLLRRPRWFHDRPSITNWDDPVEREQGQVHGLPDLAQERAPVMRYLLDASRKWAEIADGFRVDAVRHLPATFVARAGDALRRAREGFRLLGEVFDGDVARVAETTQAAKLDAVFDFPLYWAAIDTFCKGGDPGALGAVLASDRRYPPGTELVTFLDNHDLPRLASLCAPPDANAALSFLMAFRGTPCVTYGTESGLQGESDPANRGDMVFRPTTAGWLLAEFAERRRASPALSGGTTRLVAYRPGFIAFARDAGDDHWLIAVNRTQETVSFARRPVAPGTQVIRDTEPALPARVQVTFRWGGEGPAWLVGQDEALGSWNPDRAVPLPATLTLPSEILAAKVLTKGADGAWVWEAGPNRYLLPREGEVVLGAR